MCSQWVRECLSPSHPDYYRADVSQHCLILPWGVWWWLHQSHPERAEQSLHLILQSLSKQNNLRSQQDSQQKKKGLVSYDLNQPNPNSPSIWRVTPASWRATLNFSGTMKNGRIVLRQAEGGFHKKKQKKQTSKGVSVETKTLTGLQQLAEVLLQPAKGESQDQITRDQQE